MTQVLQPSKILVYILYPVVTLGLVSCGEDGEIRSYSAPNHYEGPVAAWKLPDQWGKNPGLGGMMAGSFHVKTDEGPSGRIGVMPFRESVATTSIVNMFGRELGHPDYNQSSIDALITEKNFADRTFQLIRLDSKIDDPTSSRTALLAIHRQNAQTWLFPFIADRDLIDKQLENFYTFLGSTTLREGKSPVRAFAPSLPSVPPPTNDSHGPTSEAHQPWAPHPITPMRIGSYVVNNKAGESLDFSITSFPGEVGGLLANVNRWLGQVGMKPTDESGISEYLSERTIDERPAKLVIAESDEQALYAAILFHEGRSWFLKLMGDVGLARTEKENFLGLIDSFCLGDH